MAANQTEEMEIEKSNSMKNEKVLREGENQGEENAFGFCRCLYRVRQPTHRVAETTCPATACPATANGIRCSGHEPIKYRKVTRTRDDASERIPVISARNLKASLERISLTSTRCRTELGKWNLPLVCA